jgi:hypothetical protein
MRNTAADKDGGVATPVSSPAGPFLAEPFGLGPIYFAAGLGIVRAQAAICQLPEQSLVHHRPVWLNTKDVVTQLHFPDFFTCDVPNVRLHRPISASLKR